MYVKYRCSMRKSGYKALCVCAFDWQQQQGCTLSADSRAETCFHVAVMVYTLHVYIHVPQLACS